jgi:hypothetical protein
MKAKLIITLLAFHLTKTFAQADEVTGSLQRILQNMGAVSLPVVRQEAIKQAKKSPRYRSTDVETQEFEGDYTPTSVSGVKVLAIFSDDGCRVTIWKVTESGDLENVLPGGAQDRPIVDSYGRPQHLPALDGIGSSQERKSFHLIPILLKAGQKYRIKVEYSNVVYVKKVFLLLPFIQFHTDIDGCTLFAFDYPVHLTFRWQRVQGDALTEGNELEFPPQFFGTNNNRLGRVSPTDSEGCKGYFGKVELIGDVVPHLVFDVNDIPQWRFKNKRIAYLRITYPEGEPLEKYFDEIENVNYQQNNPNQAWKVFAIDGPGIPTVAPVAPKLPIDSAKSRQNFTMYVEINGKRASNEIKWHEATTIDPGFRPSTPMTVGPGHTDVPTPPPQP